MRNLIVTGSLAAMLALSMASVATSADAASCSSRKTTGTILGGVGGALLGNTVSHGGAGAVVGGLGGAVVGHQIGKSGCTTRRSAYYRQPTQNRRHHQEVRRTAYYDSHGNRIYR